MLVTVRAIVQRVIIALDLFPHQSRKIDVFPASDLLKKLGWDRWNPICHHRGWVFIYFLPEGKVQEVLVVTVGMAAWEGMYLTMGPLGGVVKEGKLMGLQRIIHT